MKKIIVSLDNKYSENEYSYLLNEIKKVVVIYNSFAINTAEVGED